MVEETCDIREQIEEEEEEDEVSPEFQIPGIPSSLPGGNLLAGSAEPNITQGGMQVNMEEQVRFVAETAEELGFGGQLRAAAAYNIAKKVNEDIRPGLPGTDILLEDDITLTPVVTNLFSAEKSTWIFHNGTITGEGTDNVDRETQKFKAKPKELLAFTPIATPYRFPSNVPKILNQQKETLDIQDNVRWVSDKVWFNAGHLEGPKDYRSIQDVKAYHASRGADLYFINSRPGFGNKLRWGMFHFDAAKRAYFSLVSEEKPYAQFSSDTSNWQFYEEAQTNPMLENSLGFKVKNEVYVIECEKSSNKDWVWSDYFYGHVSEQILEDMGIMRNSANSLFIENARRLAATQGNPLHWRNIYTSPSYRSIADGKSLNLFPVIPFYGTKNFSEESSTDPMSVAISSGVVYTGNTVFSDYTANVTDLLTKEESDFVDVGSDAYFDIRPVYSYYDCLYEDVISDVVSELELPSPYQGTTLAKALSNSRKEGLSTFLPEDFDDLRFARLLAADRFYNLSSLSDITPSEASDVEVQNEQFRLIQQMSDGTDESARAFAVHMADYYGLIPDNKDKNILLSSIPRQTLDDLYEQRYMNPMFVEMEFGKIKRSTIATALSHDGDKSILIDLMEAISQAPERTMDTTPASYIDQAVQTSLNQTAEVVPQNLITHSDTIPMPTRMIDFSDWWAPFFERMTNRPSMSPIEKFSLIFRLLKMKMQITNFVNNSVRSYDQVLNGVPAKNELLGFMIEKYKGSELISNFYIMANNDREVERFVDSQVKYGQVYEYRINRIVAIVGNKYTYHNCVGNFARAFAVSSEKLSPTGKFDMPFGIRNLPCLKICLVPTTQKRTVVIDSPPVFPDVEIVPFKNVDNRISITLRQNGGEYRAPPVILLDSDTEMYALAALNQGLIDTEEDFDLTSIENQIVNDPANAMLIQHRSDDPTKIFEIFRLSRYPESLQDFFDQNIKTINSTADNATITDAISPNVKYYYLFRCRDIHGKISNPGHIHEVELVKVNDAVRLSHKIVNAADLEAARLEKEQSAAEMRQFIMLKPNFEQRTLNLGSGQFSEFKQGLDSLSLIGPNLQEKLWKKKFKIRVRSKDTGKEVDIDVTFNVKLTEDQENKKVNLIC